jgi:sulfate adenylyltransferase subunit 2
MHVDTGHNFPEADRVPRPTVAELGSRADRGVGAGPSTGPVVEETGPRASRNPLQTRRCSTPSRAQVRRVFGGARRDEEKARAKERSSQFRDDFGQWDPKNQRPELWKPLQRPHPPGEHFRVFPLSQLDRARHLAVHRRENIELPRSTSRTSARCSSATACCWR